MVFGTEKKGEIGDKSNEIIENLVLMRFFNRCERQKEKSVREDLHKGECEDGSVKVVLIIVLVVQHYHRARRCNESTYSRGSEVEGTGQSSFIGSVRKGQK